MLRPSIRLFFVLHLVTNGRVPTMAAKAHTVFGATARGVREEIRPQMEQIPWGAATSVPGGE